MERNSLHSQGYKLESQIRDAYGRVTYTQTCHDKIIDSLLAKDKNIKTCQIVLSAITTTGFIASIIYDTKLCNIIVALISLLLLILNSYVRDFNLVEIAQDHKIASDLLWKIREEYVSLLTDFDLIELDQIIKKRNELQDRTSSVYCNSPRTNSKSYKQAQQALKTEEEQTFSDHEIDVMLPSAIRRCNRKYTEK